MALNLGVHVSEQATSVSTPVVADVGIPFVVGAAPAHAAGSPAKANVPVLAASWDEAVEKLGFSYDWKQYPLCEFMYSHFQLFGCQPAVFCNVLDSSKTAMKDPQAGDGQTPTPVAAHQAALPFAAIASTIQVAADASFDTPLELDTDYSVLYDQDRDACLVELLESGDHYEAAGLYIKYEAVKPDAVAKTDIVAGLGALDACMSTVGLVPDLICAPGWSHDTVVAAVMATKAEGINGLFRAKAILDVDCGASGVREYKRPNDAISAHCKGTVKRRIGVRTGTKADGTPAVQNLEMLFIPEGDIYRLAAKSELPGADKFERWIFDEVLPSIRRHGAYMTPETLEAAILNPDTMIKLCTALKEEQDKRKALENRVKRDRPKVLFADSVAASKTSILVGELAKLLKQNGVETGQNRMFQWLREQGYLIRRQGTDFNMPTQKAMEMGLFEIKETAITHSDGHVTISKTPKVTGKGQQFFVNAFLSGR